MGGLEFGGAGMTCSTHLRGREHGYGMTLMNGHFLECCMNCVYPEVLGLDMSGLW